MNSLVKWRWGTRQREGWDGPEVTQGFRPGHSNNGNAVTELSPEFRGRSLVLDKLNWRLQTEVSVHRLLNCGTEAHGR